MKPWYRALLYVFTLSWDLVGWSIVILFRVLWGERLGWENPLGDSSSTLTCQLKEDSWPVNRDKFLGGWYTYKVGKKHVYTWGATTIAPHAIFYGPNFKDLANDQPTSISIHEHRHVLQGEVAMLRSFFTTVCLFPFLGFDHWIVLLVLWSTGYLQMLVPGFIVAFLRGEKVYEQSQHEQAAYDHDELFTIQVEQHG